MELLEPVNTPNPFDTFDITAIRIANPAGAGVSGTVTLTYADGTTGKFTTADAADLTAAQLDNVVGLHVDWLGRISAGTTGTVTLDTRLREFVRGSETRVTTGLTVPNEARGTVSDLIGYDQQKYPKESVTKTDDATIETVTEKISVKVTKQIDPGSQREPDRGPSRSI
ncbi:hypothetical protein G7085_16370 [Tessaracoccus sp. HDW20]|uniref:hypothetical protein n=1 Tax=Tessaracoccus coleopterorum TaxID=2714950 RepID=UPI0018D307CB|nr:hypothetical protein [Tessaracoccus coleopterorum]NHB85637.1 hypothetical protein [Tessaracoccus coleopterorum]